MDDKRNALLTVGLLCAVLFILGIADLCNSDRIYSETENRVLASRPTFSWESLLSGEYGDDYEEYMFDQFVGRDKWGNLICTGMAAMIIGQMIINVGMCLMLLPVIGITLPFFSAGGSSNLCVYLGIGVVMSIYRHNCDTGAVNIRVYDSLKK